MKPLTFIIVGSGYRALYYVRTAKRYPALFELKAMLCRGEEKAARLAEEQGIRVTVSAEECEKYVPDFVVVAVSKASVCTVAKEWAGRGFPVLLETPARTTVEELRELWELSQRKGARIQVAEQYHRYPVMAAGIRAAGQGKLGEPDAVTLSVAHDYHGVSLIRRMLNLKPEPVRLRGSRYTFPVTRTDSRYGPVTDGSVQEQVRNCVTMEFASGKAAFYDFDGVQYHSFIRSRHVNVRGQNGEWNDTVLRYVGEDHLPVREQMLPYLNPKYRALETEELREICGRWNPFLTLETAQDEYAIATMLFDMREYLNGGEEVYPLAESLEDAYIWILFERAVTHPEETVISERMPWHA